MKSYIKSFSKLGVNRVVGVLSPLVLYPYLLKTLGVSHYGWLAIALNISALIIAFISYGFELTGPKELTEKKYNVSDIYYNITLSKSILYVFSIVTIVVACFFIDFKIINRWVIIFFSLATILEVVNPLWMCIYYNKLNFLMYTNVVFKLFYILLALVFVKSSDDIDVFAIIYLSLNTANAFVLFILTKKVFLLSFHEIRSIRAFSLLKSNFLFFISRASTIIKDRSGVLFLAYFTTMEIVSLYDIMKRFIDLSIVPFTIINNMTYAFVIKNGDVSITFKVLWKCLIISILIAVGLIVFFDKVFLLYVNITLVPNDYFIFLLLPLIVFSMFLGNTVLMVLGYTKAFNIGSILSMMVFLLIMGFCYIFDIKISFLFFNIILITNVIFDIIYRITCYRVFYYDK